MVVTGIPVAKKRHVWRVLGARTHLIRHTYTRYSRLYVGCPYTRSYRNFNPWVAEFVDNPGQWWILDGQGQVNEEPVVAGPFTTALKAIRAAEMMVLNDLN